MTWLFTSMNSLRTYVVRFQYADTEVFTAFLFQTLVKIGQSKQFRRRNKSYAGLTPWSMVLTAS